MVIKLKILSGLVILASFNFSCSSTTGLYNGLTQNKVSLKYLHDPNRGLKTTDQIITITKPTITDSHFTKFGQVTKVSEYVVPVIIYNEWKSIHDYHIGNSVLKEDPATFIQSAFMEESKRSGTFTADTTSLANQFTLAIKIDSLGASGPYINQGYIFYALFIYGYSYSRVAGPGIAYSQFHYTLKRGEEIVLEDIVRSKEITQPLVSRHKSTSDLQKSYTTTLVEALSQTFKSNIDVIIDDINGFLARDLSTKKSTSSTE